MLTITSEHKVYYQAGFSIGNQLLVNDLEEVPVKIGDLGLGIIKLQSAKSDRIIIKWDECVTCSHLVPIGQPQCHLEAGLLAGVFNKLLKKRVEVEETKCWGTGDKYCQMEATIYPISDSKNHEPFFLPESNDQLLLDLAFQALRATKNYYQAAVGSNLGATNRTGRLPFSDQEDVFQMLPYGLIIADHQGRVVKVNNASLRMLNTVDQRVKDRLLEEIISMVDYSEILKLGKPQVWDLQISKDKILIIIGMPYGAQIKTGYVLFQLIPLESELVTLLMEHLKNKTPETAEHGRESLEDNNRSAPFHFNQMITLNPQFRNLLCLAQKSARCNATILILGESGTGKGVLAQAIHQESSRRHAPFIKVNCAAIPPELLESELFGYEEGAFTGTKRGGKPGKFELADGGTIFLDEIGDMPLNMQAKLLTVLQEKEIERLGGTQTRKIDVRVIAATNKDIEKMVREGSFREDLFYRLNVVKLFIPPLRERLEDIPLLVESILERLNEEFGKKFHLTRAAMECLFNYTWPGNIRELKNVLERAAILTEDQEIHPQHLMIGISGEKGRCGKVSYLYEIKMEAEKGAILQALEAFGGEKKRAAKALGISRQALYSKMARYGLLKK